MIEWKFHNSFTVLDKTIGPHTKLTQKLARWGSATVTIFHMYQMPHFYQVVANSSFHHSNNISHVSPNMKKARYEDLTH